MSDCTQCADTKYCFALSITPLKIDRRVDFIAVITLVDNLTDQQVLIIGM